MSSRFRLAVIPGVLVAIAFVASGCARAGPTPTPTPRLPGSITPTAAAERVRLDLGDGMVVAFLQGREAALETKVAYLTHVASGSQLVLDREGRVIERRDGRDDGPARLDAVLADPATMGRILAGLRSDEDARPRSTTIDWVPFIKFNGTMYLANWRMFGADKAGRLATREDLGPELYRVAFTLNERVGVGYQPRDGDSSYLDPGTLIHTVKGYRPQFRLAAIRDGSVTVFEADSNPSARVGEDLLDIRGKVVSIGMNSPQDGRTQLAAIADPGLVEGLVEMVLAAPVDQGQRSEGERYFITFHLEDGTAVVRSFWVESGELSRGIMTPAFFQVSILKALGKRGAQQPVDGPRISKELAVKLALELLKGAMPELVSVEPPHDPAARLMSLADYLAITGGSMREDGDRKVWVVEAEGEWRDAGITPPEARQTYRYGSVAIDAETGDFIASSQRHEPRFGR